MRMFMLVVPGECRERLRSLLSGGHADGYSEIPTVFGEGESGPRYGSRVFPGLSSIFLTVVGKERAARLEETIRGTLHECDPPVHSFAWDVDTMVAHSGLGYAGAASRR